MLPGRLGHLSSRSEFGIIQSLSGSGEVTFVRLPKDCESFGPGWGEGKAALYKNGNKIDETSENAGGNGTKTFFTFTFADGDEIALQDEGQDSILWVGSIDFSCSPLVKRSLDLCINMATCS